MKLDLGVDDECPGQGLDSGEAINDREWMIEYYHFIEIGLRMNIMKLDLGVDDEHPGQGLDSGEAIKRAKSRRPIIEPIGDFR